MTDPNLLPSAAQEYMIRTSSDGLLVADIDHKLSYIKPAAAGLLAITVEGALEQPVRHFFRQNQALVNLFMRDGEQRLDVRLPRRRLAQGIANTLENGERVVLLQDVTEKRDLEERREALSKAIAHDLRNPISAIGGFVDLVSKFGEVNDQQQKYLLRAKQTSEKLNEVVKTLVDLAWIEAGMPLEHLPLRLDSLIEKAVREVQDFAAQQQIGIATSLQRPLPLIIGDAARLQMVLYQILHNAVLYSLTPERNIAIHAWGDETEIYCSVADQGIGIIDGELELISDRMYRSRDERVRAIPGGGVGLTLARTIVRRHGGDLWASSNYGAGSTFTFMLPAVEL